jgi:hypothetical protein
VGRSFVVLVVVVMALAGGVGLRLAWEHVAGELPSIPAAIPAERSPLDAPAVKTEPPAGPIKARRDSGR